MAASTGGCAEKLLIFFCFYAAVCLVSTVTLLRAQTPEPDKQKLDAKACADRDRLTLGDTHELQGKQTQGANPSDKLARTGGVICPPPHLDPDINAPAPGGGRTPVIPPAAVQPPGTQAK